MGIIESPPVREQSIDELCVNTIRTLAMDAVQQAKSGHPGTPMALAPAAYTLWTQFLRFNPRDPGWFNRDRFVLSAGHASMLLYAMLFLAGYDLSLADLRAFRQWGSKTPGHPEYGVTPGVETTTGPLGQGFMNAVGMAMAEAHLAATFNRQGHAIIDHCTYVIMSDGDMMEGASHEAASLAGHLGLAKLICIYDDNHISIEGDTDLAFSDNSARRFEGYHWHVQDLGDKANDLHAIAEALNRAQQETQRPSLIILRSHIAYGAPNAQDTAEAHGAPLGEDEVRATKHAYGWPEDSHFAVPEKVLAHMRQACDQGERMQRDWDARFAAYREAHPDLAARFEAAYRDHPLDDWMEAIPAFAPGDGPLATRSASGKVLNAIAPQIPWLMGGSGDLAPSTNTLIKGGGDFERGEYANRNVHWGVREHAMCAAASGMLLHGAVRPYVASFLIFTDYARPAIRLACLMDLPMIYVMTHDSIALGEDGPTHQPIEQLPSLRALPNMHVIRPADANETAYAWRAAIMRKNGPTLLALTRQAVPIFERGHLASAEGLLQGAYILSKERAERPHLILIASGSEVQLILAAQPRLAERGIQARVVSMPSWELFRAQPREYRDAVLLPDIHARLAVEAGSSFGWCEWVGDRGDVVAMTRFGASAPGKENLAHFGFTVDNVVARAERLLAS